MGTVSFSLLSMNTPESILYSSYYSKLIHVHATAVVQTFKYKYAIGGVTSQFAYTSISCKRRKKNKNCTFVSETVSLSVTVPCVLPSSAIVQHGY